MNDCSTLSRKMIPLSKVVNAALIDGYENVGRSKELAFHWATRGVKKLQTETLRTNKRNVILTVNHNTKTATLPPDCDEVLFVGVFDANRNKIPMKRNNNLVNDESIETIACDNLCEKCNQSLSICEDLEVTEETEIVIVNGSSYTKTTIKKLYPNGHYYLETTIPYYNVVTESVEYATTKEFITALDLQSCGCLETTEENLAKLRTCCPNVYDCYYTTCSSACNPDLGGWKVFEELGLLQLDFNYPYTKVYVEFRGFMRKVNGEYVVPEVAFETLVEYTKFKFIRNKGNVPRSVSEMVLDDYRRERGNMRKTLGKVSFSTILNAIRKLPRFDIDWGSNCPTKCAATSSEFVNIITSSSVSSDVCETNGVADDENCGRCLSPFQLAVVAGAGSEAPVQGLNTYYNPELVGAVNLTHIIVNSNNETILAGDFTFNSVTGIITRINPWFDGDILIAAFAKFV